ncbi:putative bifunctional diguanylate cyclase/phosphodiesterase [Krasilnikovia sp. MM14-A1004]|uniref:putative bifunctional diguanylate cyclase/phosphodiesterase n=1 Tax=Krasilnikovia sp. MM14-A1004 TaxID=3373541 RepID=UPI00399CFD1A
MISSLGHRWRHNRWANILAAVVVLLALVTYVNIVLHRRGVAENQTSARLQSLVLLLNEESSLQWKTLADPSIRARVARDTGAIRGRESQILARLATTMAATTNRELVGLISDYHAVLDEQQDLLIVDNTDQAVNVERSKTDPQLRALSDRITRLASGAASEADKASATANYVLIVAMLLTAVMIGALLRRFDRAHRAAAASAAELLRQERAALQLANENAATIRHQAEHDALTGLANRGLFIERVQQALRAGEPAVMFVDLDDFKRINDSLGHAAGDALLIEVARRLRGSVRDNDTAARLGGDEFAILIEGGGADTAISVAQRIIEALAEPVDTGGTQVLTRGSVGIAVAGPDGDATDLLREADVAMYAAKNRGKGQFVVFDASMQDPVRSRVGLEVDLRRALETDEIHLAYQPIVCLNGGGIVGAEALVRWTHPSQGMLSPAAFLPVAEASGLILPLGRKVLELACAQGVRWLADRPGSDFVISVNLSVHQLQHRGIVEEICAVVSDAGLPPAALMLEITESALVHDGELVASQVERLRALGFGVALDDFGTGYSSITHLQRFRVDQLKIDRSFVAADDGVCEAVLRLAELLGLETVAEGIETAEQARRVRDFGCKYGQGYWFAKPVAPDAFEELLNAPDRMLAA